MHCIYITGATGFVGRNLWQDLSGNDCELRALSLRTSYDMSELVSDANIIIHLAGKAHDLKKVSQPEEYYNVNFELTKKLYNDFLVSNAKKFIFISSVKAAADQVNGELTEEQVPNPLTHYGKSKLMAEEYIQSQQLQAGRSYYILRPCMIHGTGNKGNLNLLYNFVKKGIPWPLGAFDNRRSFLSIDNLSFVIKELIERDDIPSGIYNVADNDALSTTNLIEIIANALNVKSKIFGLSKKMVSYLAKIGDILHLPLNSERLKKLTDNYVVSNKKLVDALKKPLPVLAKDGISATIRSFKVHQ